MVRSLGSKQRRQREAPAETEFRGRRRRGSDEGEGRGRVEDGDIAKKKKNVPEVLTDRERNRK